MNKIEMFLDKVQAVITGHFVFNSGKHSRKYVNKDELYTDPSVVCEIGVEMASVIFRRCSELGIRNDEIIVAAPAIGGVALTQWGGYHLQKLGIKSKAVFAEKNERSLLKPSKSVEIFHKHRYAGQVTDEMLCEMKFGEELVIREPGFSFKRGYNSKVKGRHVVVLEDLLTTGGSAKATIEAVRETGGIPFLCIGIADRSGGKITAEMLNVPAYSPLHILDLSSVTFEADACPYCKEGIPINTEVGHGAAFLARQRPSA